MPRILAALVVLVALTACGGPSQADLQATVEAGTRATMAALESQTAVVVAATATAAADLCGPAGLTAYADTVEAQLGRFDRQSEVVAASPRMSIATPLQALMDIQEEVRATAVPPCLADFHAAVLNAMDWHRSGFMAFAEQRGDQTVAVNFRIGNQQFQLVRAGLSQLREGVIPVVAIPQAAPGG